VRRVAWAALAATVAIALYVGVTDRDRRTDAERVDDVAASVACPACAGESARDSQAPAAVNVRREIARRVAAGESDDQIREALAAAYGESILLTPPRTGTASLVWVLPVVGLVVALAALGFTFRRWRAS
jgi:cytochrome c-type biogenesis protein CcmH/NrfF